MSHRSEFRKSQIHERQIRRNFMIVPDVFATMEPIVQVVPKNDPAMVSNLESK
jgi:hypothetical protein